MDVTLRDDLVIPESEIEETYSRSSGPGGQHVNKTETRVTLRFSVANSPSIPEPLRHRILAKLRSRLTQEGELLVSVDRFRERPRNQAEAYIRLQTLLAEALVVPKRRKKTRPTRGAVQRRLDDKRRQSQKKQSRQSRHDD